MDIVKAKIDLLRTVRPLRASGAAPGPDEPRRAAGPNAPHAHSRTLPARARRALWFGFTMITGFIWWEMLLVRVIGRRRVDANRLDRFVSLARRFRGLAVDLGGVWIKLGQFLSSRVDILPPEVVNELAGLQDAVPAEDSAMVIQTIERELGRSIRDLFDEFERDPVAAASFGQAHRAVLHTFAAPASGRNGTNGPPSAPDQIRQRVVVKVQRMHLDDIVSVDLSSLRRILRWLRLYEPIRRRANLDALFREFADVIYEELDYEKEARNAEAFAINFAGDPGVRVPRPYKELSTKRVLVLENVEEIKITDFEGLRSAGVSRKAVAKKMFDTYLQQIFVDGFFHADPHPGNLFVQPIDAAEAARLGLAEPAEGAPAEGRRPFLLTYIDFGMVGRVKPEYKKELKEFVVAVSLRDPRRLTAAAQRMGFFLPGADTLRIEQAISALFDRVWGMATNDLTNVDFEEMYDFALQFKDLLSTLPFQIPQNVLYLGRAVNILSGMSVALDPEFNPWTELQPFARDLAGKEGARSAQDVASEVLNIARLALQLPVAVDQVLSRALSGQLELRAQLSAQSTDDLRRIESGVSRLTWALVFTATLICGTLLAVNDVGAAAAFCYALSTITFVRMLR